MLGDREVQDAGKTSAEVLPPDFIPPLPVLVGDPPPPESRFFYDLGYRFGWSVLGLIRRRDRPLPGMKPMD
jgi:hypothetical protein